MVTYGDHGGEDDDDELLREVWQQGPLKEEEGVMSESRVR